MEFEDGSQYQMHREELWSQAEEIPKNIRNKMVCNLVYFILHLNVIATWVARPILSDRMHEILNAFFILKP